MTSDWFRAAGLWILAWLLVLPSPGGLRAQEPATSEEWQTYTDVQYGYSVRYPPDWEMRRAFDNAKGEPYLIRRRVVFSHPTETEIEIDVWDREAGVPMDRWFQLVENLSSVPETNAILDGQESYVIVESGGCGGLTTFATYLPAEGRVYKIYLQYAGTELGLEVYAAMLRSFSLTGVTQPGQVILPDLASMIPATCGVNLCPSTCWYGCTFAALSEGCCGYHAISRWQCGKECIGNQVGGFKGNCTWWGAYTRRDVGSLASGNASNWAISVRNTGQLPVDTTPKVGAIVVHPGSSYNHVAYVVWVSANGASYRVSDMGWCSDCGPTPEEAKSYNVDADDEFIHCAGDPPIPMDDWSFTNCPFGWTPSKGFSASELNGSVWTLNPASDPYLLSPVLSVPANEYGAIAIDMANNADDTDGTVYFTTDASPSFDEAKAVSFTTINDGNRRDYIVNMRANPLWQGTITRIRVDPVGAGNEAGGYDDIDIARIRFTNTDTTPPSNPTNLRPTDLSGWYDHYTRNQRPSFAWDPSTDDGSGLKGYYAAVDQTRPDGDGTNDQWVGNATQWQVATHLSDRDHFVRIRAVDNAGNASLSSKYFFTVDTTPPANPAYLHAGCTSRNNLWQNECYDPSFTWSGASDGGGSGIKDYHYYWGTSEQGQPDAYIAATSFDPGPIATPDGCATYFLNLTTRDNLDQEGVSGPAFVLRYDGQPPTGLGVALDGGAGSTNQVTVRLDIGVDDACSGVAEMRISDNGIQWTDWLPYTETMLWHVPALDRHWLPVYAQVRDKAGNESEVAQDTIYLELYPEKPHSVNYRICADAVDAGGQAKQSAVYSLVGAIGQPGAGISLLGLSYDGADGLLATMGGCPTTGVFTTGITLTHSVMASGGGLKGSASYRQANTSGQVVASGATPQTSANYQAFSGFWPSIADPVPPPPQAPAPVALLPTPTPLHAPPSGLEDTRFGVRAGDLGPHFTNQITTELTFWAPAVDELQLDRSPGFLEATWQSYVPTMTWAYQPDPELITGTRIYARFRDGEGTVYATYETTVFYDGVPPIGSAEVLTIANGTATLWLEASDDNSGVYDMRLGENRRLDDAPWRIYTDTVTVTWPIAGVVYVQYRDRAGNLSAAVSTRTEYDIYLPLVLK